MGIVISGTTGIDMGGNPVSNVDIQNDVDVVDKEYVNNYVSNNNVILQVVYAENKVVGSGSLTIPSDGTIPQITEGNEVLTCTITPKKSNSRLLIEFTPITQEIANNGDVLKVACFRNGVPDALYHTASNNGLAENSITGRFIIDTPTTSPITFSLRAGINVGSIRWNQILYNGSTFNNASTTMTITEIAQ